MDEVYNTFSINMHNRLKNTINASIKCKYDEKEDKLNIDITRLGILYKTSISNVTKLISSDIYETEKEFDKVVSKYRNFIFHKFFYF